MEAKIVHTSVWNCRRLAVAWLMMASLSSASSVGVIANGYCGFGTCPPASPLAAGDSVNDPFSFTITLADGDQFGISGLLTATHTSNSISEENGPGSQILVTYLGDGHGGASQADTFNVEANAAFVLNISSGTFYGGPISGGFGGNLGSGSSATVYSLNDGNIVVNLGTFASPAPFSAGEVFYDAVVIGDQVTLGNEYTNVFGAGSEAGSYIYYGAAPAPEPSAWTLAAAGAAALMLGGSLLKCCRPR